MLETLIITFREGLEAFLIVAIMVAYLANTGKKDLIKPVFWGVVTALIISLTTGWHIAELAKDPFMEGLLAMAAGVLVASLTFVVMKGAKHIKKGITDQLDKHSSKGGIAAIVGVFVFTIVMIAREGMETAMMLGAMSSTVTVSEMAIGALAGFSAVGVIGFLWIKQSHSINLRLFMQVTGIFLILFAIHLFTYGIYELTEVNAIPLIDNEYWHQVLKPFKPSAPIGRALTIGLIVVPCLWLFTGYVRQKLTAKTANIAAE